MISSTTLAEDGVSEWRLVLDIRDGELYVEHSDSLHRHAIEDFLFALLPENELHETAAKALLALLGHAIGHYEASQKLVDRPIIPDPLE